MMDFDGALRVQVTVLQSRAKVTHNWLSHRRLWCGQTFGEESTMQQRVAIVGAGPGGYVAAIRAAQLGARVVLIEKDKLGGTCLNWGCIPTKTLIASASLLEDLRNCGALGVEVSGAVHPNLERMMARKQKVVEDMAAGIMKVLESYGVSYVQGEAVLSAPNRIRVKAPDGRAEDVEADRVIVAAGSRPMEIPAFPYDGMHILSSNDALEIEEVPDSLLIVGGGVIGCEFAFLFNALGSTVTVVEAMSRLIPLPAIDHDSTTVIQREMRKRRIQVYLNRTVEQARVADGRVQAILGPSPWAEAPSERDKQPLELAVDRILVSVGRRPNTRGLGLEQIGPTMDPRGWLAADKRMETNIAGIYAIGDVLGPDRVMLAHVATSEAIVAVENALGGDRRMSYDHVPSAIFTRPEVASVGLSEEQAAQMGRDFRTDAFLFRLLGKAQALGEIAGQIKLIWDGGTEKVLGVHIVSPHATDLIAEATLALQMGATVTDLAETIHAHPTLSEAFMEVAHKAKGAGIHAPREAHRGHARRR
jgi:dihydrolipoamide dehydrogenase